MRKSTIEKIEQEIYEKTRLSKEVKDGIIKEVFINIMIAILIIVYFNFLILGSIGTVKNIRTVDFNIFSIIFLGLSILLFEIGYKKDSGKFGLYGVEMLIIALFTLFLPYIIFELDASYKKYYLSVSAYIAIYYSIKSICITVKTRKKYMTNVNDIKEIVKKDSKRSIEDKQEVKKSKEKQDKVDNKEKQQEEKLQNSNTPKKRGRPKKVVTKND